MRVRKAVIPAAGLGTRFLPASKVIPKEMLPLVDKPIIQYVVEEIIASGIEELLIITGRGKGAIEDHFDRSPELEMALEEKGKEETLSLVKTLGSMIDIHYIRQKEPRGLGHAIYMARSFIGEEPFAVVLGDDVVSSNPPALAQLLDAHRQQQKTIVGVQEVPRENVNLYGILEYSSREDNLYRVESLVEKPPVEEAPSRMAILGRYVLTPGIFKALEETPPGHGGEIQLTDALALLQQREGIWACSFTGQRYDAGQQLGFLQATVELALARDDLGAEFKAYLEELLS